MTELEALNIIIEKIPDIETVDNEINVIKTALENKENNTEKGNDFRTKYEELREKYIARFKGFNPEKEEKEDVEEKEESDYSDLLE
nr:MAG TPA_asm: hypothetical protein [Caudoviricetes sp.]